MSSADIGCKGIGDPPVNVLKEAVQRGIDDTLEFAFRRQFHPQTPQPFARRIKQSVGRVRLFGPPDAKPVFQILLVLSHRKMPASGPTNRRQMISKRAAVPRQASEESDSKPS